jgi:hypothetical protein
VDGHAERAERREERRLILRGAPRHHGGRPSQQPERAGGVEGAAADARRAALDDVRGEVPDHADRPHAGI